PGSYSISASYGGSTNYASSSSSTVTQSVNPASTSANISSSNNPAVSGPKGTFTATIPAVSPGGGTPPGTVSSLEGTTVLGTAQLSAGKATLATTSLTAGSYGITVNYGGDPDFNASTSPTLTEVVNAASTTSKVTSSLNPSTFGQSVT